MSEHPIITIESGQLRGKTGIDWKGGKYYSFQGIPYGKPPLGELRFKAPVSAESWSGVKDALQQGDACYSRHFFTSEIIGSEDCLYLNVYTPELTGNLKPVMVFIHGGAFIIGSSNTYMYGPEFLMSENLLLVTINYRLGLLGFANFEDPLLHVPGNAGLKDQILALQWVKSNISSFGGDPSNVTIFGESAGGSSVHYLMLSPLAKGLFHRAALASGTALSRFASGQRTVGLVSKALQLKSVTEQEVFKIISAMSTADLFKLQEKITEMRYVLSTKHPVGPVVDSSFLLDSPVNCIKSGQFNHVPLMIGYASNEGMYYALIAKWRYGELKLPNDFTEVLPSLMNIHQGNTDLKNKVAAEIKEFYYGNEEPSVENILSYFTMNTDNCFLREINTTVRLHTKYSLSPCYYFRMSMNSNLNLIKKAKNLSYPGMCHIDYVGYLFKTFLTPDIRPNSIEDTAVKRFVRLYANFARNGNPNPKDDDDSLINVKWKPTENGKLHFMDIGDNITVGINPEQERLRFWDHLFKKYGVDPNSI